MLDPLSAAEKIKDFYITYLETAFRIRWPEIQQQRRDLLEQVGQLSTDLYLEPIPRYKSSGVYLDATDPEMRLSGFSDPEKKAFVELILAGLFEPDPTGKRSKFSLYQHQWEMLQRGVQRGMPGIVTSGTGSGKTEAFLLPLLARITQEAKKWDAPDPGFLKNCWWQDEPASPFQLRRQKEATTRPKAVRALILYPMNALVEDQMVRLRKALDSPTAHQACDQNFNGNRIFFGRYTGASPVTGFESHPRLSGETKQKGKRKDGEKRLKKELKELSETQDECRRHIGPDPDIRYNFADPSGSELVSRWDMQQTPPDILITNIAMLNGMLAREVEEPIWKSTRQWLEEDPDAYFYLILDELHLQRGSAGTEFCYLLRILLNRLGLDQEPLRHKLHILSSSASLPMVGAERDDSLRYLWDMFGPFGLADGITINAPTKTDWIAAVVAGEEEPAATPHLRQLKTSALCKANVDWCQDAKPTTLNPTANKDQEKLWREVADSLGIVDFLTLELENLVRKTVYQAASTLVAHCEPIDGSESRRATSAADLADSIFSDGDLRTKTTALKGLLKVRGWGDSFSEWFGGVELGVVTTFRAHSFMRAIDGLFCGPQALGAGSSAGAPSTEEKYHSYFSDLGIERGLLYAGGKNKVRKVEVLYCECCGELFYGGMRGPKEVYDNPELMPSDPDLDQLPEISRDALFENLSADQYAIFWPVVLEGKQPKQEAKDGAWVPANYDPATSSVTTGRVIKPGLIAGFLYDPSASGWKPRKAWFTDRSGRGSATPSQCPACETSYIGKSDRKHGRPSPIRNFRTGFGKTSQLIGTELLHQLRDGKNDKDQTKLICFTDSRQEAARTALELERMHYDDVVRELLVICLREYQSDIPVRADLPAMIKDVSSKADSAADSKDYVGAGELQKEEKRLSQLLNCYPDTVPIAPAILNDDKQDRPSPFLCRMARFGVHPTDSVGTEPINKFAWQELYQIDDIKEPIWRTDPAIQSELDEAKRLIRVKVQNNIRRTVFRKTHFAIEEAGIGYGAFELRDGQTRSQLSKHDAMLRVIQDSYRVDPHPYDGNSKEWSSPSDLGPKDPTRIKFETIYGVNADLEIQKFLEVMKCRNHRDGILSMEHLQIKLAEEADSYWRCDNCGRVHLHRGFNKCTRCLTDLPKKPTGTCSQLQRGNFLGSRLLSGLTGRLRSEELTGMTDDISGRLRRFKGVFINDTDNSLPSGKGLRNVPADLEKAAKTIDVLSVTTTMEVGVDIGDLQGTYQANMPPQRFNYQQRVGRAGRRGQAYSLVQTLCRSKSHDLFYFRHPEKITGDPPPPPFLTKEQLRIAVRLARKAWMWAAFLELRKTLKPNSKWPADEMHPDIHGEYLTVSKLKDDPDSLMWKAKLKKALDTTSSFRDEISTTLLEGSNVDSSKINGELDVENEIWGSDGVVERARPSIGLAEAMAEFGYFPMFGLPTQVRNLYTGFRKRNEVYAPEQIDRDAELAIAEFAPGNTLIRDKKVHEVVGFTDSYPVRIPAGGRTFSLRPPVQEELELHQCENCDAWNKDPIRMECFGCHSPLPGDPEKFHVPVGYRTNLNGGVHPDSGSIDNKGVETGSRTIKAQAMRVDFKAATGGTYNVKFAINDQSEIYSLNRGPKNEGWEIKTGSSKHKLGGKDQEFTNQWILETNRERRFNSDGSQPQTIQIGTRKVTDSLFIAPVNMGALDFFESGDHKFKSNSIRAALLSASSLIVQKASMILDIDPSEFDVLEPRVHGQNSDKVPLIQIADHLVNGSGFCRELCRCSGSNPSLLGSIIKTLSTDPTDSLVMDMLDSDHVSNCPNACYLCIQRYSNQHYHGLLDWRLGLDFLSFLNSSKFKAGLNADFSYFGLSDWNVQAQKQAEVLSKIWGGSMVKLDPKIGLFGVQKGNQLAMVVHSFWDENAPEIQNAIPSSVADHKVVDIFELTRRPMDQLTRLKKYFSRISNS